MACKTSATGGLQRSKRCSRRSALALMQSKTIAPSLRLDLRDIQRMLSKNQIQEVDKMLCDVIEYAKAEKEELFSQGISQGELKKAIEVAKNLLKINISVENIAEATGLTTNEIEELKDAWKPRYHQR